MGLVKNPIPGLISNIFRGNDSPQFPTPSFQANLQTTLVPEFGSGSLTPTFTRASTGEQIDFEGKSNWALANEARMQGARRVRNLYGLSSTVDGTTSFSAGGGAALVDTVAGLGPNGETAYEWSMGSTANATTVYQGFGAINDPFTVSFLIRAKTGTTTVQLTLYDGTNHRTGDITLTTAWTWISHTYALSGASGNAGLANNTAGDSANVYIVAAQLENVTGQTIQTFGGYVNTSLSAPFSGAGVASVKYFDTLNGNTVAANVVTEATGARIDSSQAAAAGGVTAGVVDAQGPLGYLSEGERRNDILQSNTLGTTWTVSNAADMEAVSANQYVSVDGATTMDLLQPKATTAVHSLDQAFTFTAAKYTTAFDLRYVAATPQRWVAIILNDGTTTWGASFDLLNGVVGAVSAGATSGIEATAMTGVYRAWVTNTANAAAAAGTVKISLNATDTATLESAARAGTETLGAGMVQHEIGTFKSSRITTTTVAVTRATDSLNYPTSGNVISTSGSIYMETTTAPSLGASVEQYFINLSTTQASVPLAFYSPTGKLNIYDGTTSSLNLNFTTSTTTVQKIAAFWGGSTMGVVAGGVAGAAVSFDGDMNIGTAFRLGNDSGTGSPLFGTIRLVTIFGLSLPNTLLVIKTRTL